MATPHVMFDQEAVHEHAMVKELLAELRRMDDKARVEARVYEHIDGASHNES